MFLQRVCSLYIVLFDFFPKSVIQSLGFAGKEPKITINRTTMRIKFYFLKVALACMLVPFFHAQLWAQHWELLHPGGGGQVQGLYFDPNTEGKVFFNSDMEGLSISQDNGLSWRPTGVHEHHHLMQFVTVVEEGNPQRIYNGGLFGLEISDDGGLTWQYQTFFDPWDADNDGVKGPVAAIAIAPDDPQVIYAGNGWMNKWASVLKEANTHPTTGAGAMAFSVDHGKSWALTYYDTGVIEKNTYDISVDPVTKAIYLSAEAGIYKGIRTGSNFSWEKLPAPTGTGRSRGVTVSPNGQYVYAVYETSVAGQYKLYGRSTEAVAWEDLSAALAVETDWWRPRIDPRDTGNTHHLLLGCRVSSDHNGLWETIISWEQQSPTIIEQQKIFNKVSGTEWDYDYGWKETSPKAGHYGYTPASWERAIWVTSDEGFYTWNTQGNFLTDWQPRWTEKQSNGRYNNRGIASTFNWSMAGIGQFIAQGQADNGFVYSSDNGATWKRIHLPGGVNDCGAMAVIPFEESPVVITGGVSNYGGGFSYSIGKVHGAKINPQTHDLSSGMKLIGGNSPGLNGLTQNTGNGPRIYAIDYDKADYNKVYLATEKGIFKHSDIVGLIDGTSTADWQQVAGQSNSVNEVFVDPQNSDCLYALQSNGLWRIEQLETAAPVWTKINDISNVGMGAKAELTVWADQSLTYLCIGDQNGNLYLSSDQGSSWHSVLNSTQIKQVRPTNKEEWYVAGDGVSIGAIAGFGQQIFVTITGERRHGYAALRGRIGGGEVSWEDFSGEGENRLKYPRARKATVFESDGVPYFYIASSGMGLWRKPVDAPADPPVVLPPTSNTSFRFLRMTARAGTASVKIHQLRWYAKGAGFPTTYLTNNDQVWATVAADLAWRAYDGKSPTWDIINQYPASITLDLGNGTAITPDSLTVNVNSVSNAITDLICEGSNDLNEWTVLYDRSDISVEDYEQKVFTARFEPLTIAVTGLEVTGAVTSLTEGEQATLQYEVAPVDASNKQVHFSSSQPDIISVNSVGVLSAQKAGSAVITLKTDDGGFEQQLTVEVLPLLVPFRYLKLEIRDDIDDLPVTLQELEWLVESAAYPSPKLTVNDQDRATAVTAGSWKMFDGKNTDWAVGTDFPVAVTVDLGEGNEIHPNGIRIQSNASRRGVSSFVCYGSNDQQQWTTLYATDQAVIANYIARVGTFYFDRENTRVLHTDFPSEEWTCFPNPNDGLLYFEGLNPEVGHEIHIYDAAGRLILKQSIEFDQGDGRCDIHTLPTGIYMVYLPAQQSFSRLIRR